MNRVEGPRLFAKAATSLPPLETEEDVINNAWTIHNYIHTYFGNRNFYLAEAALSLLISKKTRWENGKLVTDMRRDEKTPDFLHELRQVMGIKVFHEKKFIPPHMRSAPVEALFCAALLHDVGEDFNVLPGELYKKLTSNFLDDKRIKTEADQIYYHEMIKRVTEIVERMTFSRKYTADDIRSTLGLSNEEKITLPVQEAFINKLNGLSPVTRIEVEEDRQLKMITRPDDKGNYIVSRYIKNNIVDWNLYIESMMEDPYAILAKFFDRNEGLSTRIGKTFSIEGYSLYLSMTYNSFSIDNISKDLRAKYPELERAFHRLDSMMGVLHRIGRAYVLHHPESNEGRIKGFNIDTMRKIDFRDYFPAALTGYDGLPEGMNPLSMILNRIYDDDDLGKNIHNIPNSKILHDIIQASIAESWNDTPNHPLISMGRLIGLELGNGQK